MNNQNASILLTFIFVLMLSSAVFYSQTLPQTSAERAMIVVNKPIADPTELIKVAIENVFNVLRINEKLYEQDPPKLRQIVAENALPYIYIERMTQLSLGKNWRVASAEQRASIIREFQTYLIRSYTNTLYLYRYAKPEMLARDDRGADKTILKLRVKNDRNEPVVLFLRLETLDNHWKITDVVVEGVSLIVTARGAFNDEISKKGIDGFIQSLIEQNRKAQS